MTGEGGSISTPLEDLLIRMREDLYRGRDGDVAAAVTQALSMGTSPREVLSGGLLGGMDAVGRDFRDGKLYMPEVLVAARAMKAGLRVLEPLLAGAGAPSLGRVVLGTVEGDIHDIGKNLVAIMMEGAGFEVVDLGIDRSTDDFLAAVKEARPQILGMSALLTTTMPAMGKVVEALKAEGLRDDVVVLVGGAPLTPAFAQAIGADAYCRDAAVAVETAKSLLKGRG
jgi:corrinoid protein of di/trimethylamine methyltransferase